MTNDDLVAQIRGVPWQTLNTIATTPEDKRRRMLRAHTERHFEGHDPDTKARAELDEVLEALMVLELGFETGVLNGPIDEIFMAAGAVTAGSDLSTLMSSNAFGRYLNTYLFAGVRFLASRIEIPKPVPMLALSFPPVVQPFSSNLVPPGVAFDRYIRLHPLFQAPSSRTVTALNFLDDFVESPDGEEQSEYAEEQKRNYVSEQTNFQLWLRGLFQEERLLDRWTDLAQGIIEWARVRAESYLNLEDADRVNRWKKEHWVEGKWIAKNAATARLGVVDLYWIARILGAEVTASGVVMYERRSWLELLAASSHTFGTSSEQILRDRDVLRSVLDITCDVIQNAFEITTEDTELQRAKERKDRSKFQTQHDAVANWRMTYDEELAEIANERNERRYETDIPLSDRSGAIQAPCDKAPRLFDLQGAREKIWKALPQVLKRDGTDANSVDAAAAASPAPVADTDRPPGAGKTDPRRWSRRVRTGESVEDLVGLAFSGGGIRSATFNLGVLQRLQELDLLRNVDYLSTVSGGGYIGAWLLGNVCKKDYWLSRLTDWEESIAHLRRFSNYLAPRGGLLSADTWAMAATWGRNALLIQLTAIVWVAFLLLAVQSAKTAFDLIGRDSYIPAAIMAGMVGIMMRRAGSDFLAPSTSTHASERKVLLYAVAPIWISSFVAGARLWAGSNPKQGYSDLLLNSVTDPHWLIPLIAIGVGFTFVSYRSMDPKVSNDPAVPGNSKESNASNPAATGEKKEVHRKKAKPHLAAVAIGVACVGTLDLLFSAVQWIFGQLHFSSGGDWHAFVWGGSGVMLASALAVVLMIGLIGRSSQDWRREWWTRYGAWIGMIGFALLVFGVVTIFGPLLVLKLLKTQHTNLKWGTIAGWIGTLISGLLAGNSSETDGNGKQLKAVALGWLARLCALIFILGAAMGVSTLLHVAQLKIYTKEAFSISNYWGGFNSLVTWNMAITGAVLFVVGMVFSWRFEINIFGLNQFYRNRLIRCYLGATHRRDPDRFTGFDAKDDLDLDVLRYDVRKFRGPFPIVNCALNLGGSSDLSVHTRRSASFSLTPLRCGSTRSAVGFAPTNEEGSRFGGGVSLGQAVSISGAAASPNMGYHTSGIVAFLLTMFNVRLGWWFPNPSSEGWTKTSLSSSLLIREFFGMADEKSAFVNVSDGGHFENLGIYELIRRRCKVIIACDAEFDPNLEFGSLGSMIRMCETDFGVKINIDVASIRRKAGSKISPAHCAVGKIQYSNGSQGYLIYLKSSITGDEDVGVEQYHAGHPDFPHESTADQFFSEDQFEGYRRLGHHVALHSFRGTTIGADPVLIAGELFDLWAPSGFSNDSFLAHTRAVDELWERFRTSSNLGKLLSELTGAPQPSEDLTLEELLACMEMIQLMENVFLDLRLDDYWEHPDNRGWTVMFSMWAKSPRFRKAWSSQHRVFGIRFEYFCHERLGLARDNPVARA
jgi:hypothetical protein